MTLSEALEAVTSIVGCYPNGGANAGDSYLGALAHMLMDYPRQVALHCADGRNGIVRTCKFLPTPSDLVNWCEKETAMLYQRAENEERAVQQIESRIEFEREQGEGRRHRLTYDELKEKYGDWQDNWRDAGLQRRELAAAARAKLIGHVGKEVFDALPNQPAEMKP